MLDIVIINAIIIHSISTIDGKYGNYSFPFSQVGERLEHYCRSDAPSRVALAVSGRFSSLDRKRFRLL
jgi:hypothetical protein